MLTYGQILSRYLNRTKDASSANSTRGNELINEVNQSIISMEDWRFLDKERTATSVASQQNYQLPADYGILHSIWTVVGGITYYPIEITDLEFWQNLNSTSVLSDISTYFTIIDDDIYLYPKPSSTAIAIHLFYKQNAQDMSASDYTTGTITSTVGSRTVTGSGTTWTSAMAGRWINIAGRWYEISVASTTSITLVKFALDTVSGATYTLGETSPIPQEFHDLILKGVVADYYDFKGDKNTYRTEYEKRLLMLIKQYGGGKKSSLQVLKSRASGDFRNPNDYPVNLG